MNKQRNTPAKTPRSSGPGSRGTGSRGPGSDASEASGRHEGLRHPVDDAQRVQQRLDDVGLDDQGDVIDDELRDRRSSGTRPDERADNRDVQRH